MQTIACVWCICLHVLSLLFLHPFFAGCAACVALPLHVSEIEKSAEGRH